MYSALVGHDIESFLSLFFSASLVLVNVSHIHSFFFFSSVFAYALFQPLGVVWPCFTLSGLQLSLLSLASVRLSSPHECLPREPDRLKVLFDDPARNGSQRGCFHSVPTIFLLPRWMSLSVCSSDLTA